MATQTAQVIDSGADSRNMDSYLRMGDVFSITAGRVLNINPKQTLPIDVQFRPRQPQTYYDTLCIFDEGCYETKCIPIEGTGIFQAFSFTPPYLDLPNIVGCQSGQGTITMQNISGTSLNITGSTLSDPTGKFTLSNPIPPGPFANNQSYTFNVTYTPNDVTTDRADEAYIDVTLSDGQVYHLLLRGMSVAHSKQTIAIPASKSINPFELSRLSLIVFDFDQSAIGPQNKRMISQFVAKSFYAVSTASITGSTDNLGELKHNEKLSQDRAFNVRDVILAEKADSKITSTRGIGPSNLLYDNHLPEGRYYCRTVRVEVETPLEAVVRGIK